MLQFAQRGKIAQYGDGERNLSPAAVDLSRPRVVINFGFALRLIETQRAIELVAERKCKILQVGIERHLVLDQFWIHRVGAFAAGHPPKKLLPQRIEHYQPRRSVGHNDGVAHVLDHQVQAIAILADHFFRLAQAQHAGTEFLVGAPQIGHVAHHRYQPAAQTVAAIAGRGHRFEQNLFALADVHQSHVPVRIQAARNRHGRQRRREKHVIQLHRARRSLAHIVGKPEKTLGGAVLSDHPMLRVGQDHRVGHALHQGLQLRNRHIVIAHAVVVVIDFEQPAEIAVGYVDRVSQLRQLALAAAGRQFHHHCCCIGAHAAGAADLGLQIQFAAPILVSHRQAITSRRALRLPAGIQIAI